MRFLIIFVCTLFASTSARPSTLEERLVTLFKELCVSQNWEGMAAHSEKLALVSGWKSRVIERGPHGHWGYAPPMAWTFDEPGTKQASVAYSIMEPHYPGVRHNFCGVSLELDQQDKEAFEKLRKSIPSEVERQFGNSIILRDPKMKPFFSRASQWHFTTPGKVEPNCARTITFPPNYLSDVNNITLFLTEYAYPDDRKWDSTRFLTWCYYTYLDIRDYEERRAKENK